QGINWVGSARGATKDYNSNDVSETSVRMWTIAAAPGSLPVSTSVYSPSQLYRSSSYDENGNLNIVYKDKEGRTVLKSQTTGSDWFLTFYVYDELGLLRCVIPPKALPAIL